MAKGAYIGVGGVARKIKKGYIGIEGEIYPNSVGLLPVGSTVKINENGSPVDYLVVHQGNPNPTMYDASCDGTWVLRKDLVVFNTMGYYRNDYGASYMHNNLLNGTFLATLDTLVQNSIVQVKIPYYNSNGVKGSLATGASGLSAQVFLLSIRELGINTATRPSSSSPVDGTALQYFESASDSKRIANYNGSAYVYWTRTPSIGSTGMMESIMNTGQDTINDFSATTIGARPAFVLPSTLLVSNGIVNGEQAELTRSGISHIIKKAYIGVGGVARPCWSSNMVEYYGTITSLPSGSRHDMAATTVGNYALFQGGTNNNSSVNICDVYNASLTALPQIRCAEFRTQHAATTLESLAFFAGGYDDESYNRSVECINSSLTIQNIDDPLAYARKYLAAATVGEYAVFGGGYGKSYSARVDMFDKEGSRRITASSGLSKARGRLAAATIGNYAIFAGGTDGSGQGVDTVDTVDSVGNCSYGSYTVTSLSKPRYGLAAATVGDYALFAGGLYKTNEMSSAVDAYNSSLTRSLVTDLSEARYNLAATTVNGCALFGGGDSNAGTMSYSPSAVVDVYDENLTRVMSATLSTARIYLSATSIGNYALFAGGLTSDRYSSDIVDAYKCF